MRGDQLFGGPHPSNGHGIPPSLVDVGPLSPRPLPLGPLENDLGQLRINDKKGNKKKSTKPVRGRSVSFTTTKPFVKEYEAYKFTKIDNDWKVADRVKVPISAEELGKKAAKTSAAAVSRALTEMSPLRRNHIDRLLALKNQSRHTDEPRWECVFVDKLDRYTEQDGGRSIRRYKRMDVIIAAKAKPNGRSSLFLGERSDTREPMAPPKGLKGSKVDSGPVDPNISPPLLHPGSGPGFGQEADRCLDPHLADAFALPHAPPAPPITMSCGPYGPTAPTMQPPHAPPPSHPQQPLQQHPPSQPQQQPQQQPPCQKLPTGRRPALEPLVFQDLPSPRRGGYGDDSSSHGTPDECVFEEDDRSSNTSYGDHGAYGEEFIRHRGSLRPQRRPSIKNREPVYREHRRISSSSPRSPPYDGASYPRERVNTIVARSRRRPSSSSYPRDYCPADERRLREYGHPYHSPPAPMTPRLSPGYSASPVSSRHPSAAVDFDATERSAEEHMQHSRMRSHGYPSDEWECREPHGRRETHRYR